MRLPPPLFEAFRQAKAHQNAGRLDEAGELYRRILAAEPGHADSWYRLSAIAVRAGRPDIAVAQLQRAIALEPRSADYHRGLGIAYELMQRPADAMASYRAALECDPKDFAAETNLGSILAQAGQLAEAEAHFRSVLRRHPNLVDAHVNLGNVLLGLGRWTEAEASLRQACRLDPRSGAAHADLANALNGLGRYEEAAAAVRTALALGPITPTMHHIHGNILSALGRATEAYQAYGEALRLQPASPMTEHNLGNLLASIGQTREADRHYRRCLETAPGFSLARSSLLLNLNYLTDRSVESLAAEHRLWDTVHAGTPEPLLYQPDRSPDRRLRIGYVSSDFRQHPVGLFLEPLLEHHDRAETEIFCYARVAREDAATDRMRGFADHWVSILALDEVAAAARIRNDRIDILIDLAGHTNGAQMALFARKPAPIQASWLGYPHGTGLGAIDYRISDETADPTGGKGDRIERIERVAESFLCYRPPAEAPDVVPLPARSNGFVTFGSFNNLAKLNDLTRALWAALLAEVPGSRLLLKAKPFADPAVQELYRADFIRRGIEPRRLDLRSADLTPAEHLGLYGAVDIALDPHPYNGTTTSCEALWMGVPVVSLRGDRHAARVGASLLSGLGLEELVASDTDAYRRIASALAGDLDRLSELRSGLRARMRAAPLLDATHFARAMEAVYRRMWQRYCAGS